MLGVLLSQILGVSRMLFAMARHGDLPRSLSHVHPVHSVPDRGVFLTGTVIAALAVFGTLEWVAASATFTILLYYSITNLAALRMDRAHRLFPDWVPALGLLFCLLLALSLRPHTIISGLSLVVLGCGFRWALHRLRSRTAHCRPPDR